MPWLERASRTRWLVLLAVIVLSRAVAWLVFSHWDVVNDSGVAVKPLASPSFLDFGAYRLHIDSAWDGLSRPFLFLQRAMDGMADAWAWLQAQPLKPGPVFPALLQIFDYETHTAPLSWVYLLAGVVLSGAWAWWAAQRGAAVWVQWLLAGFPALVYYSFLVSTDLLYAVVVAVFYAALSAAWQQRRWAWVLGMGLMALALLTRPNALALLPVLCWVIARQQHVQAWVRALWVLTWALLGLCMLIYYLPYFWVHEGNAVGTHYWGIYPAQFAAGVWPGWPEPLNQVLSWGMLAVSKLLFSVGLRPSYADINPWLVVARALPGLLFLPGLVYGLWRGAALDRVFVFFFVLPAYVGAAQERYLLPITPLLVVWGVAAYARMGTFVRDRKRARSR